MSKEPWTERKNFNRKLSLLNQQDVGKNSESGAGWVLNPLITGCGDYGLSNDLMREFVQFADARNSAVDVRGILPCAPNEAKHL